MALETSEQMEHINNAFNIVYSDVYDSNIDV